MLRRRLITVSVLVVAVGLAGLGCTTASGSGVGWGANRSDSTIFIRFEAQPDQVVTYRVDPGAVGRAEGVDPKRPPDTMTILSADCTMISEQSDPALGQMTVEGASTVFTAAPDPDVMSKPLLPVDPTCG